MPSDPAPHPSVSLATQPRALAWLWGGGAGLHMESSVGPEEPVLVGTVRRVSWRAMEQALHWEGVRAQQARQEGRRERGAESGGRLGACIQPGKIGLSGTGPVGTQAGAVEKGLRAVDPRE